FQLQTHPGLWEGAFLGWQRALDRLPGVNDDGVRSPAGHPERWSSGRVLRRLKARRILSPRMSVATIPGATAFTLMFFGPSSEPNPWPVRAFQPWPPSCQLDSQWNQRRLEGLRSLFGQFCCARKGLREKR